MIINELVENYIYFPNLLCQGYSLVPWLHSSSAPGVIGGDPVITPKPVHVKNFICKHSLAMKSTE